MKSLVIETFFFFFSNLEVHRQLIHKLTGGCEIFFIKMLVEDVTGSVRKTELNERLALRQTGHNVYLQNKSF